MKKTFFLVLSLLVLASCAERTLLKDDPFPSLQVTGASQKEFAPDQAEVVVTVETRGATAKQAQDLNSEKSKAVLKALGIVDKVKGETVTIETRDYSVSPEYDYSVDAPAHDTIKGYLASNAILVRTSDTEGAGKYLETAVNTGATRVDGLQFSLSDHALEAAKDEVLKLSVDAAKQKANTLATASGVTLGRVHDVRTTDYGADLFSSCGGGSCGFSRSAIGIQPGKITVRVTVDLTYELERMK